MRFLNHGSFGATPNSVLQAQQQWRDQMEAQPVRFMTEELAPALRVSAARLGGFIGARECDLVFVDNATTAVNAVFASYPWRSGDGLLLLEHAYPAVILAANALAKAHGVVVQFAPVRLPVEEGALLEDLRAAIQPNTKMALLDHVSSPLAVVYPLEAMAQLCHERGVAVCVDGAHGPGMLQLDLEETGADWYTGNCHKWLFAPKGSAFLWTSPQAPCQVRPLVVSLNTGKGIAAEFAWTGTRDCSAWLSVSAGIEFMEVLGTQQARNYCTALARQGAALLRDAWGTDLLAPEAMHASMWSVPLPARHEPTLAHAAALHDWLWRAYHIEVPVLVLQDRLCVRISAQVYNDEQDYAALAAALSQAISHQ